MSAGDYARFLRKLLSGELRMSSLLGADKVCTLPSVCPYRRLFADGGRVVV